MSGALLAPQQHPPQPDPNGVDPCTTSMPCTTSIPCTTSRITTSVAASDLRAALEAQRAYFMTGATRSIAWRKEQMTTLMEAVAAHSHEFTRAQIADNVRPFDFAQIVQFLRGGLSFYLANVERWARDKTLPDSLPKEMWDGVECEWTRVMEPKGRNGAECEWTRVMEPKGMMGRSTNW